MSLDLRRSKIIRRPLLAFPLAFLATPAAFAADGDNSENAADFAVLCRLMRLAERGYDESKPVDIKLSTEYENSIKKATALADFNETNINFHKQQKSFGLKETDKPLPQSPTGKAIAIKINRTAAVATALANAVEGAAKKKLEKQKNGQMPTCKKRCTAMETPLNWTTMATHCCKQQTKIGCSVRTRPSPKTAKGGSATDRGDNTNAGKTIINDIFCLCIQGEGEGKKLCEHKGTTMSKNNNLFADQITTVKNSWGKLLAACPQHADEITSAELSAALTAFRLRLGANEKAPGDSAAAGKQNILGYIGNTGTGCTGATKQTCVNYAYHFLSEPPTDIPWVALIRAALREARDIVDQPIDTQAAQQQLAALNETVWDLYHRAFEAETRNSAGADDSSRINKAKAIADKKQECGHHKDNKAACENANCKWDGKNETDGTCKPKDGEGQTKEAGETPNAESKKCFEKKNQEDCKDGCKWEDNNCKDSSILVNKHFALSVVSAAFVALLF
uniref:Variable surface glycoprotein n=1 Tax=Trypanosoma evansi TaxID=5697 RepID=Q968K8_TRYEV|nr:variable surface glycoprotein [Trypanosoma evansi]